ncbi:MAG: histidine kinase dimerization/phospho-acceptor domain-containing protein, partial [Bacteroidota bacterium]
MMKRVTLRWIVGLMGISMIGLIAFQLYWIGRLVKENEDRFQKNVMEALNGVANKLERQETINAYQKLNFLANTPSYDSSVRAVASARQAATQVGNSAGFGIAANPKMEILERGSEQVLAFSDTMSNGSFEVVFNFSSTASNFFYPFSQQPDFGGNELRAKDVRIQELEDRLARVSKKYQLTFDVMEDLMGSKKPLAARINPGQLDTLLKYELKNKGIALEYAYGVANAKGDQFLYYTKGAVPDELAKSTLKASLFPNDLYSDNSQLVISFPEKGGYLFGKIWTSLLSSGLLALVILFCFGYSIRTIIQQKKLSEMKTDFINNMTHELKTPISTVSLAVEALTDKDIEQNPLRERYINVIGEENKRLGTQVEKVLQIAAIDRQDFNLKKELLKMSELVAHAKEHISIQIEQRGGRINLIERADRDLINGDETHITNII